MTFIVESPKFHSKYTTATCVYVVSAAKECALEYTCMDIVSISFKRSFLEVLKDREHLEYFRHYLLMQGVNAETPLQFWIAVEDIKSTISKKRAVSHKMKRIRDRFVRGESSRCKPRVHWM